MEIQIRKIKDNDREWIRRFIIKEWSSEKIIGCGKIYYPHKLPGFVAVSDKKYLGLITYAIIKDKCELVSFNALKKEWELGQPCLKKLKKLLREMAVKKYSLLQRMMTLTPYVFIKEGDLQ